MHAEAIARALGGRKAGAGWVARCPAHDDHAPSLSIRDANDGRVLARCHAGCDQGRVITALRSHGLWNRSSYPQFACSAPTGAATDEAAGHDAERSEAALAIWQAAAAASGTLVETYLASRGLP